MIEPMTTCAQCGKELAIGDYPFCPHETIFSQRAQRFDPIIVHRAPDGSYSFPGTSDATVPAGYERVEIRDMRAADRVVGEINRLEDARIREEHYRSTHQREAALARSREVMDRIKAGGAWRTRDGRVMHGLSSEGREFAERAREYVASKQRSGPSSANFHIDVLSHDSSNREPHRDARTEWRARRA
jgi:hypothetical protein